MAAGRIRLGRRRIAIREGDTIAAALHRADVRTLTRSIKHHRRRGLHCGTGDCPNCLVTVDGVPGVRACITAARDGMRVRREGGWPSVERDVRSLLGRVRPLLPVGFYHKAFIRPRWAWPVAERVIRRAVGLGRLRDGSRAPVTNRHVWCDVLVVGAGAAGRAAAASAAADRQRVVLCDQGDVPAPPDGVEVLAHHAALGVYDGPMVPLAADGALVQVHPRRVVVATGTIEVHPVFPGNDLPGVMLGRAASMLAAHGVRAGARAVVVVSHEAGLAHVETMLDVGVRIAALAVPRSLADRAPEGLRILVDAEVVRAEGTDRLRFAVLRDADGIVRGIGCDAFVLSVGLEPRDDLLRTAAPHEAVEAVGGAAGEPPALPSPAAGVVCLCEDVSGTDLARAWREGFRGTELLKRYSTTTMGPCQGAMCGRHLAAFAAARGAAANAAARTTARPPVRPVPLGVLAAAVHEVVERRTGLHDLHVEAGARIGWSGGWLRPFHYGDWREEHRAVRERVSLLDVGTLAKHLVTGPDAATLLDVTVATRVRDQPAGTARYVLVLDEAGYVVDDGLLSLLPDGDRYLTTTSGGAARIEATLRDRVERFGLRANVVELTGERGAILVAGPRARELLARVTEGPSGLDDLRPMGVSDLTVCGVPCLAIRSGFVGEVAIELHHPRSRGPALWRSLLRAGEDLGIRPHGLDALEVLRLEKGHVYMGQDSLPDDTPEKLGLGWAVDVHKRAFLGKRALERLRAMPLDRKLVGLAFDRGDAGLRGLPLIADGIVIGRVTSAAESPTLVRTIGLGWVRRAHDGSFPTEVRAGRIRAAVVPTTFLDPEGARLHG